MPHATTVPNVSLPKAANLTALKPVPAVDVTQATDERTQTLRQLLDDGHASMAPLRHPNLKFHTHLPHIVGSAYRLGASSTLLKDCYAQETSGLVKIEDEPFIRGDQVSSKSWRHFFNKKPYTVAYVDFFDGEVKHHHGDWKKVLETYLYDEPSPIINGFTGGLGHPFIHLAYAYEFQHAGVATEALSLGCTELDPYRRMLEQPLDKSTYETTSLAEVIREVHQDKRFDGLLQQPGFDNCYTLLDSRYEALQQHLAAWQVVDPLQQLEQICDLSVLLAISSADVETSYDFFLVHLMTVAHALRVLWKEFPEDRLTTILKEYAIFAIVIYTAQLRRPFDIANIVSIDLKGRDWDWVVDTALKHEAATDSHFFKVVSAPKVFAETYGEKDGFYLKAAVKFLTEYESWTGFGGGTDGFDPSEA